MRSPMYSVRKLLLCCSLVIGIMPTASAQQIWSMNDCIDYALTHSIILKKSQASTKSAHIDVKEKHAAWLPTMSANLSESATWRPLQESAVNYVNGGITTSSAKKTTTSGSYGINAGWTIYNGGQRRMGIENAELIHQRSQLSEQQQASQIVEQIAQLYVQILYMEEARKVNAQILHHDSLIWQRGVQFMENGKMARASVLELEANVASGHYDLVNTTTQIAQAKLKLAQLLELPSADSFNIAHIDIADHVVLSAIPAREAIYERALKERPEMKSAYLAVEQSQLATRMARAAYLPTISLNAGVNDSHMTGAVNAMGKQLRNNLNAMVGLGVSIPILDQRRTKSNIERARVNELTAQLDLADAEKTLYQTIEQYWLTATNSQQKYIASRSNVASREASFMLLDEQFRVGLKNISDLLQSRSALLQSRQVLLQDKYTTLLNRALLDYYAGKTIDL